MWESVTNNLVVGSKIFAVVNLGRFSLFRFRTFIASPLGGKGVFVFIVFCILSFVFD